MNPTDDIEQLLTRTPRPSVVEGPHRMRLKEQLLRSLSTEEQAMHTWKKTLFSRPLKAAAACLVAVLLVATGWAAQEFHEGIHRFFGFTTIEPTKQKLILPDGSEFSVFTSKGGAISSDDPIFSEQQAMKEHEEVKSLIAQRKYEFVKIVEVRPGDKQYVYRFPLAGGDTLNMNFSLPLEQVATWEEYVQKCKEEIAGRHKDIQAAIVNGKVRLVDVDVIKSHICKDAATGEMLNVMRIVTPGLPDSAVVRSHPLATSGGGYTTSWADHLQAITDGKRDLLDIQVTKEYTYQITLPDGSTTTWCYGGDAPLMRPNP